MLRIVQTFILLILISPLVAGAKYHKKQDADYVREWCQAHNGASEVSGTSATGSRVRADCVTSQYAVEVDSAEEWEPNLFQAKKYGDAFNKPALLVMVVEEQSQLPLVDLAKEYSEKNHLGVQVEKLENFKSKSDSLNEIPGPIVKMSTKHICHVKGVGSYGQTKNFKKYGSLDACLKAGGNLPGNVLESTLRRADRKAILAAGGTDHSTIGGSSSEGGTSYKFYLCVALVIGVVGYAANREKPARKITPARTPPNRIVTAPSTPPCPKCGVGMTVRRVSKGTRKGLRFWGCLRYPRCKGNRTLVSDLTLVRN